MRVLSGYEADQAHQWLERARQVATTSGCLRARCGTVIVRQHGTEAIIGQGSNGPPGGIAGQARCLRKHEISSTFRSDKTCCIHSEQQAILDAMPNQADFPYSRLYFVRLDDQDRIKPSGQPYCTICSKMTLHVGIAEFCLIHQTGITVYGAEEYNDLSYLYTV